MTTHVENHARRGRSAVHSAACSRRLRPRRRNNRRGAIVVLSATLLIVVFALLAMSIDIGYLQNAKTELQKSADAAALAAAAELVDDEALKGLATANLTDEVASARNLATQYAGLNKVCAKPPTVNPNSANATSGDVVIGYLSNPSNRAQSMDFAQPNLYNAVQVTVRRTSNENGEVPFFFARVLGHNSAPVIASSTAALLTNFQGFKAPGNGGNLMMLPFALDKQTWDALMNGTGGSDSYKINTSTMTVSSGADSIKEVNLFPQGTGSPGNRGTVDIGSPNNSTADIARQIVDGISPGDLSYFPNGELKFDNAGKLYLNGDTGISAGVKDELASIIGQPRLIPIFESVAGPGNNATYTIVKFVGVRIMAVKLTGSMSSKYVMIQPCHVTTQGGIPSTTATSTFIHSPVYLVR